MSSSAIAVSVRGLSKSYSIAHNATRHTTAAEALVHRLKNPFQRIEKETFWALKDVSFDIKKGEVVGIIGRNGAGKSTLLKILSRITLPTTGQVDLYGRVGSLLEVGTGFHPELTGRENIYLNGAILGMSRHEITRQFDAIVDFAGVERFLDTPVKRYSSGMHVRLAFAVAAHLNPEILIVDEVLAVGDSQFQKKCLGKMEEVAAQEGRTVLFVSHNMTNILQLCSRALLLRNGSLCVEGQAADVVETYIQSGMEKTAEVVWDRDGAPGDDGIAKIRAVRVLDTQSTVCGEHYMSQPILLEMEFWCGRANTRLNPSFHVITAQGVCVFATTNAHDPEWGTEYYAPGLYRAGCVIPAHLLNEGPYQVSAFVVRDASLLAAQVHEPVSFHVHDGGYGRGDYTGGWIGITRPLLAWHVESLGDPSFS